MKNLFFATFLIFGSIILGACDNGMETEKREFTVTHSGSKEGKDGESTIIFFAYMHSANAGDWAAYERATYEICALIKHCAISWFAGKAPESTVDLAQNKDTYLRVGSMSMDNYELAKSLIDCDYIEEPQVTADGENAPVFCLVSQKQHERKMQGLDDTT